MGVRRILAALALLAVLFAGPSPVAAQNPWGLTVEVLPATPLVRPNRPTLLYFEFQKGSPAVVEGELRIEVLSGTRVIASLTNDAVVLSSSNQTVRQLIPSIPMSEGIDSFDLRLTFVSHGRSAVLSLVPLRTTDSLGRHISVAALATNRLASARETRAGWDDWQWERLIPATIRENQYQTVLQPLDISVWPTDPLAYCSFDVLIVPAHSFHLLRGDQLEAILAWVRAGGSLYVEASPKQADRHGAFLATLVEEGNADRPLRSPKEAEVLGGEALEPLRLVVGWGRAVVDDSFAGEVVEHELADDSLVWLWRIDSGVLSTAAEADSRLTDATVTALDTSGEYAYQLPSEVEQRLKVVRNLEMFTQRWSRPVQSFLMPTESNPVPLMAVALVLLGYLVMIGPGDWFVLGWLRRRKWTWVTFPVATVVATVTLTQFANAYLSVAERPRVVEILDTDRAGRVVRRNEYALTYLNAARQVETPIQQSLVTPLDASFDRWSPRETDPLFLRGQFPTGYQVSERFAQWTPSLSRRLRIPRQPVAAPFDWEARFPELVELEGKPLAGQSEFMTRFFRAVNGQPGRLRLPTGEPLAALWQSPDEMQATLNWNSLVRSLNDFHAEDYRGGYYNYGTPSEALLQSHRFLHEGTIYPRRWSVLFAGSSPTGGRSGFDLVYAPRPGRNDSILTVVVRTGDGMTIVRRPFLAADGRTP